MVAGSGNGPRTEVTASTYTALITDGIIDCQGATPQTITLPDAAKAIDLFVYTISDAWRKGATVNNVTILDESGSLITKLLVSGTSVDIQSNGTDWGLV
jgi:hypothetical protein